MKSKIKFSGVKGLLSLLFSVVLVGACNEPAPDEPEKPQDKQPSVEILLEDITESSISFTLSSENADKTAYYVVEDTPDAVLPEPADVFENGEVSQALDASVTYEAHDLKPSTAYIIYAAASKDEKYSEVKSVKGTTIGESEVSLISDVKVSKLSVSYNVNLPKDAIVYHAYIEKWFFDYQLAYAMQDPEFNMWNFCYNMLTEYGMAAETSGTVTWASGGAHPTRFCVSLHPGKEYYVLAAAFKGEFYDGKPAIVTFTMPESDGTSTEEFRISTDEVTFNTVTIRMECDENKIAFFYYDLYSKEQFDTFIEKYGEDGMKEYLFQNNNGQVRSNTYTDKWDVDSGKSYVLVVNGFDYDAKEFYYTYQVDIPVPEADLSVSLIPYERELQGYHKYDALMMSCFPQYFANAVDADKIWCSSELLEASEYDRLMDEFQHTPGDDRMELARSMFKLTALSPEEKSTFANMGYFERVFGNLKPDTKYAVMAVAMDGAKSVTKVVKVSTEAKPAEGESSAEYKAFLGNWKVTGQTTEDWGSYQSFNIRIEEFTPNHSYKVYGWPLSDISGQYPFVAQFDESTSSLMIEGPQVVGTLNVDGISWEVIFTGKVYYGGALKVPFGYNGPYYMGALDGDRLRMFPATFEEGASTREIWSMNYILRNGETYSYAPGAEYDVVHFFIDRVK